MQLILNRLKIENFKGLKSYQICFGNSETSILGANGTGKTTVYDAFSWLIVDKDSLGNSDFSIRPLDKDNKPIPKLVVSAGAEICINGTTHILKKEQHEKTSGGEFRGYETQTWIDDVPKKIGEYAAWISERIPEDAFRLLTDLHFFNGGLTGKDPKKMHWTQRRAILLKMAGQVGTPQGFDELLGLLNGREIDDYKNVIKEQKKLLEKEQQEIGPRIDELQRSLDRYIGTDPNDNQMLIANRNIATADIKKLDDERKALLSQETERQRKINKVNELKGKRAMREAFILNDASSVTQHLTAKADIEKDSAEQRSAMVRLQDKCRDENYKLDHAKAALNDKLRDRNELRDDYNKVNKQTADGTCSLCGQKLPENQILELVKKKDVKLADIKRRGIQVQTDIDQINKEIQAAEKSLTDAQSAFAKTRIDFEKAEQARAQHFVEIEHAIKNRKKLNPKEDTDWLQFTSEIEFAEAEIGEPVASQLDDIEIKRSALNTELISINNALASTDERQKTNKRIGELSEREKELAQAIADKDKTLKDIENYKTAESNLIESSVNKKFKHVTFKLFNRLINGETEDTCEAVLDGVPYADMSCGQKIIVGIDIINVLSEHFQMAIPLFIDNAESLTYPCEAKSQTVKLYADENCPQITLQTKTKKTKKEMVTK